MVRAVPSDHDIPPEHGGHPFDEETIGSAGVGHGDHVAGARRSQSDHQQPIPGREGGLHAVAHHLHPARPQAERTHHRQDDGQTDGDQAPTGTGARAGAPGRRPPRVVGHPVGTVAASR